LIHLGFFLDNQCRYAIWYATKRWFLLRQSGHDWTIHLLKAHLTDPQSLGEGASVALSDQLALRGID